ncbi:DUF3806 domain-containing protein [Nocardia jejuensis]|uniref:DUF3806 domain-containing protein n=1 Tax=Nocardia jejuensis TaxID=328049 RepID=UPI0008322DA8|nr:DUF3806 domain-containing protein [Nocardia jejuensis]
MSENAEKIAIWEHGRREDLHFLQEVLGAEELDLEQDPLALLATLDHFVSSQDYDTLDEDGWLWLHTVLAAYIAHVILVLYEAHWDVITDSRGPNYVLVVKGIDGSDHLVSPMDVVHDDFGRSGPPDVARMLGTAELSAGVALESWNRA